MNYFGENLANQHVRQPSNQLQITKVLLADTGTYNDQVHKPYIASLDGLNTGLYNEITQGRTNIMPSELAGFAGQVIRPVAASNSLVAIPNAWGSKRFRFQMEVVAASGFDGEIVIVLTGFTNHYGVTNTGSALDPNMQFFINNCIHIRRTMINTPTGQQIINRVVEASHVLVPPTVLGAMPTNMPMNGFYPPNNNICTMTPQDVIGELSRASFSVPDAIDFRNVPIGNEIRKSARSNTVAPNYLAKTITGINNAADQSDISHNTDPVDMFAHARDMVKEAYITNDPFINYLNTNTSFQQARCITLGELRAHFPNIDHVTKVYQAAGARLASLPVAGSYENMTAATQQTTIANIISNSVPSLLMDTMLTKINFTVTNQVIGGGVDVRVTNCLGFTELDLTPYIERFKSLFLTVVWPDISYNNMHDLSLAINADILGDTFISIGYLGQPSVDYVVPTFSDALFSPIIAPGRDCVVNMAGAVTALTQASNMHKMQQHQFNQQHFNPGANGLWLPHQ